jgi:hypothetical protein
VVEAKKAEDIKEAEELEDLLQGRRNWNSISSSTKQPKMKFFPHGIGRDRQAVSYDTVKDHTIVLQEWSGCYGIHQKSCGHGLDSSCA